MSGVVTEDTLVISEVFGATIQGEGPSMGRVASFVRLGGCNLTCKWCTVPGMLILRPDFTWTPVEDLQIGDVVLGRTSPDKGKHGRLMESIVMHTSRRIAPLVKVNGNLTCSADTRAWVSRNPNARMGWREFTRAEGLNCIFVAEPAKRDQSDYERGYVAGMADGDGCFWTLQAAGKRPYRRFRLALSEQNLLDRTRAYAASAGFTLRPGKHEHTGFAGRGTMPCLWLTNSGEAARFEQWVEEDGVSESWSWGYLAGIFDAEGSISQGAVVRIAQYPTSEDGVRVYERIATAAERCGFTIAREPHGVRLLTRGGELWRFLTGATPAKSSALSAVLGRAPNNARKVVSVEDAGEGEVVSLTTSTGNYIAEGWLVHNCDTPYTWNGNRFDLRAELSRTPVATVLAAVERHRTPLVVVTGGEPLLHQAQPGFTRLLRGLVVAGKQVEVETNGTLAPSPLVADLVARFNVSPKLGHAGMEQERRIRPAALKAFVATGKAAFKWVCRTAADVDAVAALTADLDIPANLIWIMPEGTSQEVLAVTTANVAPRAIFHRFNFTPRLHVQLWGDKRGH